MAGLPQLCPPCPLHPPQAPLPIPAGPWAELTDRSGGRPHGLPGPYPPPGRPPLQPPARSEHSTFPGSLLGGLGPLSVLPPPPSAHPNPLQQGHQQLDGRGYSTSFLRSGPGELLLILQGPTKHLLRAPPSFAPQKNWGCHLRADLVCPQEKASPPPSRSGLGLPAARVWAEASPQ